MKRREFLAATAIGTIALATHQVQPTFAQEAEATPEGYELIYEGQIVKAHRGFEADGLRMGAMMIDTIVAVFDSKKNAENGFETSKEIIDKLIEKGEAEGSTVTVLNRDELSAPKLGKKRHAESVDLEIDGTSVTMVIFRAQKDELLHVWSAIGFGSPAEDLFNLTEKMRFEDVDPDKDDELLALLPVLEDVPVGMSLSEEEVTRESDED